MSATARDWRVTSAQEVSSAVECIRHAQDDADADMLDVLRNCWRAHTATAAAVGSWTQSLLLDGRSWAEIAEALDVPVDDVETIVTPLITLGSKRLHERLPASPEDAGHTP